MSLYDRKDYKAAHAYAQAQANKLGMDYGIEKNRLFDEWHVFLLPQAKNRFGYELRCEVVHPIGDTKTGHGYEATRTAISAVPNGGW